MIEQLLNSLYRAFDKDPHVVAGLRISHADGVSWSIAGRTLVVHTELDALVGTYDLEAYTLTTLADELVVDGCQLIAIHEDKLHCSAAILMDGQGIESSQSNGNLMLAYDTLLWSFIDAFALELERAKAQIPEAMKEIIYTTADTEFLDYWGIYWGFPRLVGELDADYVTRTIDEITRKRSNPIAIEESINRITGQRHRVREPWQELMLLSDGQLSGSNHMQGLEWQYHYGQVVGWGSTLTRANEIANADRPAGTLFLPPNNQYPGSHLTFPELGIISWEEWFYGCYLEIGMTGILSENLVLSGYVDDYTVVMAIGELLLFDNLLGLNDYSQMGWLTFCVGEIILSDSDPLESLQAHFGGRELNETGSMALMSDLGNMSDDTYRSFWVPIDKWFETSLSRSVVVTGGLVESGLEMVYGNNDVVFLAGGGFGWTGAWDTRHWVENIVVPILMTNTNL